MKRNYYEIFIGVRIKGGIMNGQDETEMKTLIQATQQQNLVFV